MKHWTVNGRDLDLNRMVEISDMMVEYAHRIHKNPKRMIWALETDEYLTTEEKNEAIEWIKTW